MGGVADLLGVAFGWLLAQGERAPGSFTPRGA